VPGSILPSRRLGECVGPNLSRGWAVARCSRPPLPTGKGLCGVVRHMPRRAGSNRKEDRSSYREWLETAKAACCTQYKTVHNRTAGLTLGLCCTQHQSQLKPLNKPLVHAVKLRSVPTGRFPQNVQITAAADAGPGLLKCEVRKQEGQQGKITQKSYTPGGDPIICGKLSRW
jgi:hypothetical protein